MVTPNFLFLSLKRLIETGSLYITTITDHSIGHLEQKQTSNREKYLKVSKTKSSTQIFLSL